MSRFNRWRCYRCGLGFWEHVGFAALVVVAGLTILGLVVALSKFFA